MTPPSSQSARSGPPWLTPTEIGRELGMERKEVIDTCMATGVPVYMGRISLPEFRSALDETRVDLTEDPDGMYHDTLPEWD